MMDCLCHTARSYSIQLVCAVPPLKKRLWAYHLKITFRCSNGTAGDPFPSHVSVLRQYITVILCINYARTISKPLLEVARATLATFSTRGGNFDH